MKQPTFPAVAMNLAKPSAPGSARVVSNESCLNGKSASFTKHLVLDITDTPLMNNIVPGQAFGIMTPGLNEKGKPNKVRLYSNASPRWGETGDGTQISTTPKRLIDEFLPNRKADPVRANKLFLGVCSNYLCDLQAGDTVNITGPIGHRFLLPETADDHDFLFLATGTGIAPFRGHVARTTRKPTP